MTITGTVKPFVRAEIEREWGWLGFDREIEVDLVKKLVLVASRIVGGNDNVAVVVAMDAAGDKPVGTSGGAARTGSRGKAAITDPATLARGGVDLVGREVDLSGLKVDRLVKQGGFFAKVQNSTVFVLPASKDVAAVREGDTVSLKGVVFELSDKMEDRLGAPAEASGFDDDVYIYARSVNK